MPCPSCPLCSGVPKTRHFTSYKQATDHARLTLNKCTYCVSHHAPKLRIQGVSEEGAGRLLDYKDHPELDAIDRLVVEYAIAVTNNWNMTRDEVFTRLREHFSEAQIVELTWRIALCGAFNRFNDILQFDIEQGVPVREAAE
jgi:alkylhydroperoxidase family enzyme